MLFGLFLLHNLFIIVGRAALKTAWEGEKSHIYLSISLSQVYGYVFFDKWNNKTETTFLTKFFPALTSSLQHESR